MALVSIFQALLPGIVGVVGTLAGALIGFYANYNIARRKEMLDEKSRLEERKIRRLVSLRLYRADLLALSTVCTTTSRTTSWNRLILDLDVNLDKHREVLALEMIDDHWNNFLFVHNKKIQLESYIEFRKNQFPTGILHEPLNDGDKEVFTDMEREFTKALQEATSII